MNFFLVRYRCDQYRWNNGGSKEVPKNEPFLKKYFFYAHAENISGGSKSFRKIEYRLLESEKDPLGLVLVYYIGDSSDAVPCVHGNSRSNQRNFVRNAPYVVPDVKNRGLLEKPKEVYAALITAEGTAGLEAVEKPRNIEQV